VRVRLRLDASSASAGRANPRDEKRTIATHSAPDFASTSRADAGVQTSGWPWTLKLVSSTAPQPGRARTPLSNSAN
jgi:hypothetical protein